MNDTLSFVPSQPSGVREQSSSKMGAGDANNPGKKNGSPRKKVLRYDPKFMLKLRFVPLSTSAPENLPAIPHVTFPPRPQPSPPATTTAQKASRPHTPVSNGGTTHAYTPNVSMFHMQRMLQTYAPVHYLEAPLPQPLYYQEYPYKRIILKNIHNGIMTVYDTEHPNGSDNYSYI